MKEKGFTLIELLAVIVILAIIALIATPIILGIIKDSKKEAAKVSVQNYFDAVELAISKEYVNNSNKNVDGTYTILQNGKIIKLPNQKEILVDYEGKGIITDSKSRIKIKDGKIDQMVNVKFDDKYVILKSNGIDFKEKIVKRKLVTGENFNGKIKTLANGSYTGFWVTDKVITSIEFYSYGSLPNEYNQNTISKLKKEDVSENADGSIMAYYDDNGSIYICSKDLISFNEDCSHMFASFGIIKNILFYTVDTSLVKNMNFMFQCYGGTAPLDLSMFDTSSVENMNSMFQYYSGISPLDLSLFDTSKVENMSSMFSDYNSLAPLNLDSFDTRNVKTMSSMFYGYQGPDLLDLSNFDTSNVTTMSYMFNNTYDNKPLKTIYIGDNWNIDNVDVTGMFNDPVPNLIKK